MLLSFYPSHLEVFLKTDVKTEVMDIGQSTFPWEKGGDCEGKLGMALMITFLAFLSFTRFPSLLCFVSVSNHPSAFHSCLSLCSGGSWMLGVRHDPLCDLTEQAI